VPKKSPKETIEEGPAMKFANLSDESLLAYYESIRRQVAADTSAGGRYRLVGSRVKEYADALKDEMSRRQLSFTPIHWPPLENAG
jgi:hypothetical protein